MTCRGHVAHSRLGCSAAVTVQSFRHSAPDITMPEEIDLNYWIVGADPSQIQSATIGTGRESIRTLTDQIKQDNEIDGGIDIWKVR